MRNTRYYMLTLIENEYVAPVSLNEIKAHLRIDDTAEDTYLAGLVNAAVATLEAHADVDLTQKTYQLVLPCFTSKLQLRRKLVSVESIDYYDSDNELQSLEHFKTFIPQDLPGWLEPVDYWPATYPRTDAVSVTFDAGYEECPAVAKQAICLLVGHWYENREAVVTGTIATELPLAYQHLANMLSYQGVL
jgi:uncharacterized phiE125 gp8 family phage protein